MGARVTNLLLYVDWPGTRSEGRSSATATFSRLLAVHIKAKNGTRF